MLTIAICDDMKEELDELGLHISNFMEQTKREYSLTQFVSAEELIEAFQDGRRFQVIFLDVVFSGKSGMDAARFIRTLDSRACIVFVTSTPDFALEGYSVKAFDYVLKPIQKEQIYSVMEDILNMNLPLREETIAVRSNRTTMTLKISDIQYMESMKHNIYITLGDGRQVVTYEKLDYFKEILSAYSQFLRCHKSYIVNFDYVRSVGTREFVMNDERIIPIPRETAVKCRKKYYDYILQEK